MGRFLGLLFIAAAVVCLIFVITLEPKDEDDFHEENYELGPRESDDSEQWYNFHLDRDSDFQLNFDGNGNVRVLHRDQRTGDEHEISRDSNSGYYEYHVGEDGEHEIRFQNQETTRTNVHFTMTTTTRDDDDGPRPLCGILTPIFLILGIIFMKRKKDKGPVLIHARETEFAAATSLDEVMGMEASPSIPPSPGMEYAPPQDHPINLATHEVPGLASPDGTATHHPGAGSTSQATTAAEMDISTDATRDKPFPMPTMEDRIGHEFRFPCPDCGTVIFINRKIKKVTCPKCSHTFKIKQQ